MYTGTPSGLGGGAGGGGFQFGGSSDLSSHHQHIQAHPSGYPGSALGLNELLWSAHLGIPPGALYSPTFLSMFPAIAAQIQAHQTIPWGNKLGSSPPGMFSESVASMLGSTAPLIPFDLSLQAHIHSSPNGGRQSASYGPVRTNSSPNPRSSPYSQSSSSPKTEFELRGGESEAMDLAIKTNLRESNQNSFPGAFSKEKSIHLLREKAKSLMEVTEGSSMDIETSH